MKSSVLPSPRFGLNGRYAPSLLKTTTFVGIGELRFDPVNITRNASRNCSSFVATRTISLSEALPIRLKFLDRTWSHSSLATPPKRLLVTANTTKTNVGISLDLILLAKDGPVTGLSEKQSNSELLARTRRSSVKG